MSEVGMGAVLEDGTLNLCNLVLSPVSENHSVLCVGESSPPHVGIGSGKLQRPAN